MGKSKVLYEVLVGINYPPKKRAEIGDVRDDIPGESIPWLLEQGIIRVSDAKAPTGGYASTPPAETDPATPAAPDTTEGGDA